MKKLSLAAFAAAGIGLGAFLYATRPLAAPSADGAPGNGSSTLGIRETEKRYRVDGAASKATFTLDEVLNGQPFTVVGETNQVSGEFFLNPDQLALSRIDTIRINARTFKTDSSRRDAAIGRLILKAEDPSMEYVSFYPKTLEGSMQKVVVGKPFTFKVTGDLVIAGTSRNATFSGSATLESDERMRGEASATVKRGDYKLVIPSVPFVANVEEEVELKIEFVANPVK